MCIDGQHFLIITCIEFLELIVIYRTEDKTWNSASILISIIQSSIFSVQALYGFVFNFQMLIRNNFQCV